MIEFRPWSKIARLYRDMVISEKIDGTSAAVGIKVVPLGWDKDWPARYAGLNADINGDGFSEITGSVAVFAQSRNKIITPGKSTDNHGFAAWVWDNADQLVSILGPGIHYGEYWGSGINRGYDLPKGEKRFSLFNTSRWSNELLLGKLDGLSVVPVLYRGMFDTFAVDTVKLSLREHGSYASPGFMRPEGCVVYHAAANQMFKTTLDDDEAPKEVTALWRENADMRVLAA